MSLLLHKQMYITDENLEQVQWGAKIEEFMLRKSPHSSLSFTWPWR